MSEKEPEREPVEMISIEEILINSTEEIEGVSVSAYFIRKMKEAVIDMRKHGSLVAFHYRVFGPVTYYFIDGEHRRWKVWERDLWEVCVHDAGGIRINVEEGLNDIDALSASGEYYWRVYRLLNRLRN